MIKNAIDDERRKYYNLTFINTNTFNVPAEASESRSTAILDNPSDWIMSVVRFDIDAHSLPLNLPAMQHNSLTETQSYVTVKKNGVYFSENVTYQSNTLGEKIPAIYNYQRWLDLVNDALKIAYNGLGGVGFSPIYIFNPLTGLIDLYVDSDFIEDTVNKFEIYFNPVLYLYLTNFQYDFYPEFNLLHRFKLNITNENTILLPPNGSRVGYPLAIQNYSGTLYKISQFAPGTSSWSSVRGIVLQSTLIPARKESVPLNTDVSNNLNSNSILPIISDFLVPVEQLVTDNRCVLEYLPTAEYRRLDLLSATALKNIDFKIYWSDFLGKLYPVELFPNTGMSIKILFEKK